MKRIAKVAINCTNRAHVKLNKLCVKVIDGLTENAAEFPDATDGVTKLKTDQALYAKQIGTAKGNATITKQRNMQADIILADLQALGIVVDEVADGDVGIIALSGFDSSLDPSPKSIPEKVVISRVINGAITQTAKIFIESTGQTNLVFHVRISTVANAPVNDPSWVTVLQTTNSRELIIPNLTRGKEVFIQVNAMNAAGTGLWSEAFPFILQ
jgi:hypothetical protein